MADVAAEERDYVEYVTALRRLACLLCVDADCADDLVQQTIAGAAASSAHHAGRPAGVMSQHIGPPPRPWSAQV